MTLTSDRTALIVRGMESYFRTFALAEGMLHHAGDIEWICPQPGSAGPSIVFRVSLDVERVQIRLAELVPQIRSGAIPSMWVLSPDSTPSGIADYLAAAGFTGRRDPDHPEPGMALDVDAFAIEMETDRGLDIHEVNSPAEWAQWVEVANEALHGWDMLSVERYNAWLRHAPYTFYLGCHGGAAVATLATLQDGIAASVEFVSTLKEYRRHGAATALCVRAIRDLRSKGIKVATLRSSPEAIQVYSRLGFRPYYEQLLMSYPLA